MKARALFWGPTAERPWVGLGQRAVELLVLVVALAVGHGLLRADLLLVVRLGGAFLLLVLLPGWLLVQAVCAGRGGPPPLERALLALGSGYALAMLLGLSLHAAFRPIDPEHAPLAASGLSVLLYGLLVLRGGRLRPVFGRPDLVALGVLALAAPPRLWGLDYSEFQGDEALVLLRSMAAAQGLPDALIAHRKVPGEILLLTASWTSLGATSELVARLPFALAGVAAVVAFYRLGALWLGPGPAALAAAFLALNGYFVAFGRLLQYQNLGFLLECLALLCGWRFAQGMGDGETARRRDGETAGEGATGEVLPEAVEAGGRVEGGAWRYGVLGGLLVCAALLLRMDAVFILPPLLLLVWPLLRRPSRWPALAAWLWPLALLLPAAAVVYVLRFEREAGGQGLAGLNVYLGQRMGGGRPYLNDEALLLSANHYLSTPYLLVALGLGMLAVLPPLLARFRQRSAFGPLVRLTWVLLLTGLVLPYGRPTLVILALATLLLLLTSDRLTGWKAACLWFAGPFLTYLFLVRLPGTHWREAFPGLLLLGAGALAAAFQALSAWPPRKAGLSLPSVVLGAGVAVLLAASAHYVYVAWVQPWPEYQYLFPSYRHPLDFSRTTSRGAVGGTFGLAHRHGWKAVGVLAAEGKLAGDYVTNERPSQAAWYLGRGQGCPETAQWTLQAAVSPGDRRAIERGESPGWHLVGRVLVDERPSISILGRQPVARPASFDAAEYEARFDAALTSPWRPVGQLYQPSVNHTPAQRGCRSL